MQKEEVHQNLSFVLLKCLKVFMVCELDLKVVLQ